MLTKQELERTIKLKKKAVLVVNAASRKGRRLFLGAVTALAGRGITLAASYQVRNPARIPEVVRDAIAGGYRLIIIGGGDGTISSIVDYFAYKDVVFGLLPLGTANSFARTLGIPLALEQACDIIVNGKVADIDLGKVNEDYFANVTSIGFTADVARTTPRRLKRMIGHTAYIVNGVRRFFTTRRFRCNLISGETRLSVNTHLVIIANGSFFGVTDMSPEARIESRQLFVISMDMMSRWDLFRLLTGFLFKKQRSLEGIKYFKTKKVTIETDPPRPIDIDGEVKSRTPATIALAPQALKVIVPLDFKEHP